MATHRRGPRHARTREGIALSAVIAAVVTVIALLVAPNQNGAHAATGPVTSPTWTDNIGERVSPQDAGPNGTVLYFNPPSSSSPNRGISPTGDSIWTSPPPLQGFSLSQPVSDAAGNTYEVEQVNVGEAPGTPGRSDVVARNGSTILWDVTPDSSYELFNIAVGNGRIYVLGALPDSLATVLFTLDATTGATITRTNATGAEVLREAYAYNGGVVVQFSDTSTQSLGLQYFTPDGSLSSAYLMPSGYGIQGYRSAPQVATDGTAYLSWSGDPNACVQPKVAIVKPDTGLTGPFTLSGPCMNEYFPPLGVAAPQGFAIANSDDTIMLLRPDGTATAPHALPATTGQYPSVKAMHANTDGNVIVVQQSTSSCAAISNYPCDSLQFDLVDPATGNLVTAVALQQPTGNVAGYVMSKPEQNVSFNGTRLYATLNIGTSSNLSGTDDLEAFDGPNLGLEYPESQLQGTGSSPNPSPTPTPTTPAPSTSPTPSPSGNCPAFQFFGVRGSGEKQSDEGGYGPIVGSLKDDLAKLIPGMATQPIAYPAIGIDWTNPAYPANYGDSVDTGAKALLKAVQSFITACPTTYFELGGLSQGDDVIDQVYSELTDYQRQRALVVEFGSPHFNPKQPSVDYGTYDPKLSGILVKFFGDPPAQFPSRWAYRNESYCASGDPVCNYSAPNLTACVPSLIANLCIHQLYDFLGFTADGAKYSYRLWKNLPKLK